MILKNLIVYMLAWNLKIVLHSFKIELKPSLVLKKKGHVFVLFYLSYVIPYIQLLFGPFLNVVWIFWGFALWWLNPLLLGVKNYYKYNLLKAFWWSSAVHSQAQLLNSFVPTLLMPCFYLPTYHQLYNTISIF